MKVFLISISIFFGIIVIPFTILLSYIYYANSKLAKEYKTSPEVSAIVIGDSHTQKAINDYYWPGTINLSQSSECFVYSLIKLKAILKTNPNIKSVYLGCGYNSFSSYYNEFIFGRYSDEISSRYFLIMPERVKLQFLYYNRKHLGPYLINILTNGISNLNVTPDKYSFLGRYETYHTTTRLSRETVEKRIETQFYSNKSINYFSAFNILYLRKIIDLCKEQKVRLILLNPPMHKYYVDLVPKKFIDIYNSQIKLNELKVIDCKNLELPDSCFLPDGDHVTGTGARLTTLFIVDYLKRQEPK